MTIKRTTKSKSKTRAVVQKLIEQHRPGMIKPEVLCIGPAKTGTTWLFSNLHRHPQVWVAPNKELNFLSEGYIIPHHSIKNFLFGSNPRYQWLRAGLKNKIMHCFLPSYEDKLFDEQMQWMLNYLFGKRSFEWYFSLFPVTPKLCIDISPLYYWLPSERIKEYQAYNPKSKIIILIRNPIERVWSDARMMLFQEQRRRIDQVEYAELIKLFDVTYQQWRRYSETIALWQSYFDDVCVEYYDRLNENPTELFTNICTFLDIDKNAVTDGLDRRVNEGLKEPLPLELRQYLYNQYAPEMNEMADSGVQYARTWLDEHRTIINGKSSAT